jgi:hypothetical protein
LEKDPEAAAVGHGYFEVHENTKEVRVCTPQQTKFLNLATPEAAHEALLGRCFLLIGALTVRIKVLQQIMPIPEVLTFCADAPIAMASMAMGVRVLEEPLCYYRHHSNNLYAVDRENMMNMRRRSDMEELMFEQLEPLLARLGVREDSMDVLLYSPWVQLSRSRLRTFGGSRIKTLQTEMRSFHSGFKNPSLSYRLFQYGIVGAATLLLPPQRFYRMREWYWRRNLGRIRELFARSR